MAGGSNGRGEGAGIIDIAAALGPFLALAGGGRGGNQAYHSLALLASLSKNREEREKEARESEAANALMTRLGLTPTPGLSAAEQFRGGTLEHMLLTSKAAAEEKQRKEAEDAITRAAHGQVASLQAQVGTELPETLQQRAGEVAPFVGRTPALTTEHGKLLTDIRDSAKRLEMARTAARPFQETRIFDLSPRTSQVGPGPNVSLLDGEDLPMPPRGLSLNVPPIEVAPVSLTTVPDDVHALQRYVMQTGEAPTDKNAERLAGMFNLPLRDLPGGEEAHRAAVKPPYPPKHELIKGPSGEMTPVTMQTSPSTGEPEVKRGEALAAVGTPEPPASFDQLVATANDLTQPREVRLRAKAMSDAIQRAHIERSVASRPERQEKVVGETGHVWINDKGEYADFATPVRAAAQSGYFQLSPKEEGILHQMPQAITMLGNLMETSRQLRDNGGFRTASGISGVGQRVMIAGKQQFGDPAGTGGLLNTWAGQKSELISLYRQLGEKGNIAARVLSPQLDALTPGAGFTATARMLGYMKQQLLADVQKSRLPGFADKLPQIPDVLFTNDPRYQAARAKGLTDADLERPVSEGGMGLLIAPAERR